LALGGEGGGAPAMPGDATWVHAVSPGSLWTTAGGDYDPALSSALTVGNTLQPYTWASTPRMVADVQGWLDARGSNHGWAVIADESVGTTAKAFSTREEPTASLRPQLLVVYLPPAAAVTAVGAGCTGTGANPLALAASGLPTVPNPTFRVGLTDGPAGPSAFTFSLAVAAVPFPLGNNCFVYVDLTRVISAANGDAMRGKPLPVPNDQNLLGARLAVQGIVLDTAAGRLSTSNALDLKIGL
jgi:hypothetical protein